MQRMSDDAFWVILIKSPADLENYKVMYGINEEIKRNTEMDIQIFGKDGIDVHNKDGKR